MKKWIAIYARQSKDKKDSLSMEGQVEKCKQLINSNEDYKVYDEDKGYSGKNTFRPSVERLLKDIKSDRVCKVIVYKLDRLSRNITDFYNLYEIMKEHACEFVSVNESFDTGSVMGRAMMGILAVFAQMERENIQQRVKDNYYYRITFGSWPGGPAPLGFKNGVTENGKKTLIPVMEEIEIICKAFTIYAYNANISLRKIAIFLEEQGMKGRTRTTFDNVAVARMFQNPVYAIADERLYKYYQIRKINFSNHASMWNGNTSAHVVGKKPGNANIRKYQSLQAQTIYLTNFEGYVDSKTFIKVQERLAENEQIGRANGPSRLEELAGMVKCAKCGYAVKMYSYPRLGCYGKYGLRVCDVKLSKIQFSDIQKNTGLEIQKVIDNLQEINMQKQEAQRKKLAEINQLKKEIKNLVTLAALGSLTADAVKDEIEQRQKKVNELELDIQMNSEFDTYSLANLVYKDLDTNQKKAVVHMLIEKILLSENGDIKIIWKI